MKRFLILILVIVIAGVWLGDEEDRTPFLEWRQSIEEAIPSPRDFVESFEETEPPEWLIIEDSEDISVFGEYRLIAVAFFRSLPQNLTILLYILGGSAVVGVLASHYCGIKSNLKKRVTHPNQKMMYSYFVKSGDYQQSLVWSEARKLNKDHKWWLFSFAGAAHWLGNYTNQSKVLIFALSVIYIPFALLGFVEMIFRRLMGFFWFNLTSILLTLFFMATSVLSFFLRPISRTIDKILRKRQYCPHCYDDFELPEFACPNCEEVHDQLTPSHCGVLWARCSCNNALLPVTAFTGRSHLAATCPSCKDDLVAANATQFSIQLIGGTKAGRTSYLAAFAHAYINGAEQAGGVHVFGEPANLFERLEKLFQYGETDSSFSGTTQTYSLVHKRGERAAKDNLVFYDIPGEVIIQGGYQRSPKNFGFCDGLIFIIDPLSTQTVWDACAKESEKEALGVRSHTDTNTLISQFVQQFEKIRGLSTKAMNDIPVAVLINKIDISVIGSRIGDGKPLPAYDDAATDKACRDYLLKIGLGSAINNLDANFTNIRYFPVSATGRKKTRGMVFEPVGVIAPVSWIAQKGRANIAELLKRMNAQGS